MYDSKSFFMVQSISSLHPGYGHLTTSPTILTLGSCGLVDSSCHFLDRKSTNVGSGKNQASFGGLVGGDLLVRGLVELGNLIPFLVVSGSHPVIYGHN